MRGWARRDAGEGAWRAWARGAGRAARWRRPRAGRGPGGLGVGAGTGASRRPWLEQEVRARFALRR